MSKTAVDGPIKITRINKEIYIFNSSTHNKGNVIMQKHITNSIAYVRGLSLLPSASTYSHIRLSVHICKSRYIYLSRFAAQHECFLFRLTTWIVFRDNRSAFQHADRLFHFTQTGYTDSAKAT